jgi:hypothetical protein
MLSIPINNLIVLTVLMESALGKLEYSLFVIIFVQPNKQTRMLDTCGL